MVRWAYSFGGRYRSTLLTFSPIFLVFLLAVWFPPDGRERAQWIQFIGRFHPLAVHLPIALMLLVPVLEVAARWDPEGAIPTRRLRPEQRRVLT